MLFRPAARRVVAGLRAALGWCRPAGGGLVIAVLAGLGAAGSAVGLMATSAWLISRAAQHPPVLHLMVAIVAVRAFGIGRGVLRYAERLAGHDAALRMLAALRVRTYRRLVRLAPAGLAGFRRGDLAVRLAADVDAVVDLVVRVCLPIAVAAVTGLAAVLLVGALLPAAGAALAAGLLVAGVGVPVLQSALVRRADARLSPLRGALAAGATDLVHGLPDLLAAGATDAALAALDRTDRALLTASRRSAALTGASAAVTAACTGLSVLAGLAAGAAAVRAGSLPGELLAVVVLTPLAVFETVGAVPAAAQGLAAARAALRRLTELAAIPDPAPDPTSPAGLPVTLPPAAPSPLPPPVPSPAALPPPVPSLAALPPAAPSPLSPAALSSAAPLPLSPASFSPASLLPAAPAALSSVSLSSAAPAPLSPAPVSPAAPSGLSPAAGSAPASASVLSTASSIASPSVLPPTSASVLSPAGVEPPVLRVEGVTVGWTAARPVLRDLSLTLRPGQRVALVGPSGAGKSTVAALLLRWLDPTAGRVTLNGVDLRELRGDDVRRVVGLLGDDAYLFDTTIEANLRIGRPEATREELFEALAAARIDGWVRSLPDGLDTLVGEHGAAVSGGQRRRLALARVLLADFPVLILDEPTEHLDEQTATGLLDDLLDATRGRTVLLITHRADVAARVDEVISLAPDAATRRPAAATTSAR
ncbi:amino acid ABC transporter ATP-binding/permease protein [Dactylosporangium sp. CA-092794]|uniref:amino acid ABC transporter ATP-binding/permease protein n=1 Tax=Dactylosporangium sp. CA-092794 TaxID=3239929 RepID=UPI003D8C0786